MKIVILQDVLASYRVDLFNRLAAQEGCELKVFLLFSKMENLQWDLGEILENVKFRYELLEPGALAVGGRKYHSGLLLFRNLRKERPDVIISSEFSVNTAVASLYAKLHGAATIAWWAGTPQTESNVSMAKRIVRRLLSPRIDRFIAYSRAARDYLLSTGISADRIDVAGNLTFDADGFFGRVEKQRSEAREFRRHHDWQGKKIILVVGALIPRKNQMLVLKAVSELPPRSVSGIVILFIGDGPLKSRLEEAASQWGIDAQFLGHAAPRELPLYYSMADLLIHPTLRDHWSQTVNEAMAAGLPVIVSSNDHATELIEDGNNGFRIDTDQPAAWAEKIRLLLDSPELMRRLGDSARRTAASRDVRSALNVFLDSIRKAVHPSAG